MLEKVGRVFLDFQFESESVKKCIMCILYLRMGVPAMTVRSFTPAGIIEQAVTGNSKLLYIFLLNFEKYKKIRT